MIMYSYLFAGYVHDPSGRFDEFFLLLYVW